MLRILAASALFLAAHHVQAQEEACWLASPGGGVAAKCEQVDAPLGDGSDQVISLRVARLGATTNNAKDDPVFFLAGGPGQAATEAYPGLAGVFAKLNATRDVVLIDQRGTGGSAPLDCPIDEQTLALDFSSVDLAALARQCLAGLDHDPRYFLTDHAAADIDVVRRHFGYETINLVGVSYGTRLAQRYANQYPDHVRTLLLDGVVPNPLALGTEHAINLQRVIDRLLERCANEPDCNAVFPDLAQTFDRLQQQVEQPLEIEVRNPKSGINERTSFDHATLGFVIRLLSYSTETQSLLPLLVHRAAEEGDFEPLVAQAVMIANSLGEQISRGLELAIMCAEDVPLFSIPDGTEQSLLGTLLIEAAEEQCQAWPDVAVPADRRLPLTSDVPTMLLSGELDPVTPPSYGETVVSNLNNGRHLVVAGQGHNVLPRGCVPMLVTEFIDTGDALELDVSCLDVMGPMPFFLTNAGPKP
ncbi:MAG: alpha/beta hydrolase [Lysobacteraceae bacterium]|nr:MAG: alpha/beta hydrolase [Xanthomonadaceae bacterium]